MHFSSPEDEWEERDCSSMEDDLHIFFDFSDIVAENPENEIEEPTRIDVYVDPKTSLIQIHDGVRSRFVYDKTKICGLESELKSLKKSKGNMSERKYQERKKSILEQIESLDFDNKWKTYKNESIPILKKYLPLMPPEVKGTICVRNPDAAKMEECLNIIIEYIEIVNRICNIQINCYYQQNSNSVCPICECLIEKSESKRTCNCGYIDESITCCVDDSVVDEKSGEKQTNTNPKPQLEWLKRFLGEGDYSHFNQELFDRLDRICIENNLPTSEIIKSGQEEDSTDLLIRIAKLGGIDYCHRNALASRYWGWELPVLTDEQKEEFKKNCIITRKEYPIVSKRRQNLNLDISGYLLFGLQGLVFSKKLFKFPSNNAIIRDANEVWIKTCKNLNFKNYVLIE